MYGDKLWEILYWHVVKRLKSKGNKGRKYANCCGKMALNGKKRDIVDTDMTFSTNRVIVRELIILSRNEMCFHRMSTIVSPTIY